MTGSSNCYGSHEPYAFVVLKLSWATSSPGMAISRAPEGADVNGDVPAPTGQRKKVVVVGLGMVGVAFV